MSNTADLRNLEHADRLNLNAITADATDKITDKTDKDLEVNDVDDDNNELDPVSEKKLTRRYDIFIIPMLGVSDSSGYRPFTTNIQWLYLLAYLDRVNMWVLCGLINDDELFLTLIAETPMLLILRSHKPWA